MHIGLLTKGLAIGLLAVLGIMAAGAAENQEDGNLLRNPGAEQGTRDTPSTWYAAHVPAEGLRMWRDLEQAHSGEASLAIANEHAYREPVCNNWAQELRRFPRDCTLQLSAYVRTEGAENVIVCVQCWDKSKQRMLGFAGTPVLRGTHDWTRVETEPVYVLPEVDSITVRAVLTGKGQVWFDDLVLAELDQAQKPVDERLHGVWIGQERGRPGPQWIAVFCADKLIMLSTAGEGGCGTIQTDDTLEPCQIDATTTCACPYPMAAGVTVHGIYRIEGDTLTLCYSAPSRPERPTDFEGQGARVFILERQGPSAGQTLSPPDPRRN